MAISLAVVLLLSALLGVLGVLYLTVHPLRMGRLLAGWWAALFGAALLLALGLQGTLRWVGVGGVPVLASAAYLLTARRVLAREDPRPLPALTRAPGATGKGHTAVVYFTHGEPETYDPIGWINQFRELDHQGVRFIPMVARPVFLQRLRTGYLRIGRSEHRGTHQRMLAALERAYRDQGDATTRFYLCFLDDHPRPDAAVVSALNDGADRIIVAEVFLTVSSHTAEGKHLIDGLEAGTRFGVPVRYSGPLHDSGTLRSMFPDRADRLAGGFDRAQVGVLLIGHGQPDEWDAAWPTQTSQEISFREGVLDALVARGFPRKNVGLAWMEFKDPKPAEKAEELARSGVRRIVYFSAAISADSMHSQYDVPELLRAADLPAGTDLVNAGAWNDDPTVIRAIKEKIDAQMAIA